MRIAFLSSLSPTDIHNWSGTLYHIYTSLCKHYNVNWIGSEILEEAVAFYNSNDIKNSFVPEENAMLLGKLLTDFFNKEYYDLIICRDYFFCAYLVTNVPLIYIGDTTFSLFNQYMKIENDEFIATADQLEYLAIKKADRVIYCSEWAKQSAVKNYQAQEEKVKVIEFGANIKPDEFVEKNSPSSSSCNLIFVGTNWKMKGGSKVLDTYTILKEKGIDCKLTIVGSCPPYKIDDENILIYPCLDKGKEEEYELMRNLFSRSHFLIVPTLFDCYGIVFCEAAAFGLPSLASDVGGVAQILRSEQNGFLFSPHAEATEYADKIMEVIREGTYSSYSKAAITAFKERLNWDTWAKRIKKEINDLREEKNEFYIPVYAINVKERTERRKHILKEFARKKEFDLTVVDACVHEKGTIGLWNSIVSIVRKAVENKDEVIVICEDDHYFTDRYSPQLLFGAIREAYIQGADILSGGIGGFGQAIPVGCCRYWMDWFWCTQFIVVYSHFFETILAYEFKEDDTADGVLSQLSLNKMVIYPFISEQKDFGYSDVTQSNMENQGRICEHFSWASRRLEVIESIYRLNKIK